MPLLNKTISTLGMAGFMDKILVVVEAENTNRDAVKRGYAELIAARANVSVVLNKTRSTCPSGSASNPDSVAARSPFCLAKILKQADCCLPKLFDIKLIKTRALDGLYYRAKPLIPWRLRLALRRFTPGKSYGIMPDTWPIQESACRKPADWSGWPEENNFPLS